MSAIVMRLHPAMPSCRGLHSFAREGSGGNLGDARRDARHPRSDGSPLWSAPKDFWNAINVIGAVDGNASIAAGDCKGDGRVCFVKGGWDPTDCFSGPPSCVSTIARETKSPTSTAGSSRSTRKATSSGSTAEPAERRAGSLGVWGGPASRAFCRIEERAGGGRQRRLRRRDGQDALPADARSRGGDQVSGNGVGTLSASPTSTWTAFPRSSPGTRYKLEKDAARRPDTPAGALFGVGVRISSKPPNCPYGSTTSSSTGHRSASARRFEDFCPDGFPALANFAGYGMPMGIKPEDKHPQIVVATPRFPPHP